jgi:UDP-glucuronate decarboxylase
MNSDSIIDDLAERCRHLNTDFFQGKRVVISGASGLIGTYLLAYFALLDRQRRPFEVIALSHSSLSGPAHDLIKRGGFTSQQMDLSDYRQYTKLPLSDLTIHAAGYAQPSLFMANPAATLSINVAATLALLQNTASDGTFIFLSSSEVYCGAPDSSCKETSCGTSTPYHPRSAYIEGKRSGEAACAAYRTQGLRAIAARLGDIYGPGTRPHDQRALNSFIEQALTQGHINLRDQGAALRSYCYVTDAVESLLDILILGREQVYNVSAPYQSSIRELALLIGNLTGAPVSFPATSNEVPGAPPALSLDLSLLDGEFHKTNYLSLDQGLIRTIAWQRDLYAIERARVKH